MLHTARSCCAWLLALLLLQGFVRADEGPPRFPLLNESQMTPAQRELAHNIRTGPRAAVAGSAANASAGALGSPFNVFLRSPELGEHLQRTGSYIRFKSVLGPKLTELAILVTARHWTAQYEWHAHHRLALQAGLSPDVAQAIAQGQTPTGMTHEEALVFQFCQELHQKQRVSDATFEAVKQRFGEQGVMDLIAVNGYYVLVAMVLNVDRTPIPGGAAGPLPVLK